MFVRLLIIALIIFAQGMPIAAADSFGDYLTLNLGDPLKEVTEELKSLAEQGVISLNKDGNSFKHDFNWSPVIATPTFVDGRLSRIVVKSQEAYPISHCDSPWIGDIQRYMVGLTKQFGPPTQDFNYPSIDDPEAAIVGSITLAGKWLFDDKEILVGVDESTGEFIPLIILSVRN